MSPAAATSDLAPLAYVALHEAGHARVARALDVHVEAYHLSVERVGEWVKVEGHISFKDPAPNSVGIHAKHACRDMIAIAVAGHVAERAWFGPNVDNDDETVRDKRDGEAADYWIGRLERMQSVSSPRRDEVLRQQMTRAATIIRRDSALIHRLALEGCERIDRELHRTGTSASITVDGEEALLARPEVIEVPGSMRRATAGA
jgi:hypothetical protein